MKTKSVPILFAAFLLASPLANAAPSEEAIAAFARAPATRENIALGRRLLSESPDSVALLVVLGTNLVARGDGAEALALLQKAIRVSSQTGERLPPYAVRKLAEAYFATGKYSDAEAALAEAAQNSRDARRAEEVGLSYGLSSVYKKWRTIETAHLRLHFSPKLDEARCASFARTREEAFEKINRFFGASLPKKIDFFVWSSRDEAKQVAKISQLGFAVPHACVIHSRHEQTPGHELTHVISFQAFRPDNRTRLINEGLAVLFDQTGRDRLSTARTEVQRTKTNPVSIAKFWGPDTAQFPERPFYSVAAAFVERLREKGGDEKFRRLCADQTHRAAKEIYGSELDAWIAEFERDLNAPPTNSEKTPANPATAQQPQEHEED